MCVVSEWVALVFCLPCTGFILAKASAPQAWAAAEP